MDVSTSGQLVTPESAAASSVRTQRYIPGTSAAIAAPVSASNNCSA
jgi:hypothetical protein